MQSPNSQHSFISGRARSIVSPDGSAHQEQVVPGNAVNGERSGSRGQLDRAFRRVTLVGAFQSSLRRGGSSGRLI